MPNVKSILHSAKTVNGFEKKGGVMRMSATISGNEKSRQQEYSSAIERIKTIAEHWYETANDEFGFGVINGLRLAIEVLEGKR